VRDSSGELQGVVAVIQDVSLMKQMERMREEWTSVIAHDLRQPLSVMLLTAANSAAR